MDVNQKQIAEIKKKYRVREEGDLVIIQDPSTHNLLLGAQKTEFGLEFHWVAKRDQALDALEKLSNAI